jgi:hypothetical protein
MAISWRSLVTARNNNTNTADGGIIDALLASQVGDDITDSVYTGSQVISGTVDIVGKMTLKGNPTSGSVTPLIERMAGSFSITGSAAVSASGKIHTFSIVSPASSSVSGVVKFTGTGSIAALVFSGSHVRPNITSGGQEGEWRFVAPWLYVYTGSAASGSTTGCWLVFTGSQV